MRSLLAAACETPRKLLGWLAVLALALWIAGVPAVISAQPEPGHEPAAASASHTEAPHEESIVKTVARLVNFAILVERSCTCCDRRSRAIYPAAARRSGATSSTRPR